MKQAILHFDKGDVLLLEDQEQRIEPLPGTKMIKICWIGNAILVTIMVLMYFLEPFPKIKWHACNGCNGIFSLNLNHTCYWILFIIFNVVLVYKVHRSDKYEKWKEDMIKYFED